MTNEPGEFHFVEGFEWDEGNRAKSHDRHGVTAPEVEEVFGSRPLLVAEDQKHSAQERRLYALGQTASGRRLFVVFTLRESKIRPISARDMSRAERTEYERAQEPQADPQVP